MGEYAGVMAGGAYAGQAVGGLFTASAQAKSIESQAAFQRQQFEMNSKLADLNAADAIRGGEREIVQFKRQVKQVTGSQRARLAAQGIEIDSGSALDVQLDTAKEAELTVNTIRNNAYRQAWGYKMEAISQTAKGQFTTIAAKNEAKQTMLGGVMSGVGNMGKALDSFSNYFPSKKVVSSEPPPKKTDK